jgi:predicted CopG family antitoxin
MTKSVSLSDEAYRRLRRRKRRGESFSDVIIKLTEEEPPASLLELRGAAGSDAMRMVEAAKELETEHREEARPDMQKKPILSDAQPRSTP